MSLTAINHLISGVVDAHTWLTVLVRFVAGLLVRGRVLIAGFYGDFPIHSEPSWQNSILSFMAAIILILPESLSIRDYSHPYVVPHGPCSTHLAV